MTILNHALAAVGAFALLVGHAHAVEQGGQSATSLPERAGYYDTVWPSEHSDLWRSHAVLDAGLPADFNPRRLRVSKVGLNLPMWGYTRDPDEVFVLGGSLVSLDAFTESYKFGVVPSVEEFLVAVVLGSRDPSVPYVAKIRPYSMRIVRQVFLTEGTTVNYTGGLLIHQNGYIYAVASSVLYKIDPDSMRIVDSVQLPLVEAFDPFWTAYNGIQVIASGQIVAKGYNLINPNNENGWLLLVDPDDLSFDAMTQEPVSSPRLTIGQDSDGETWLYHSNKNDTLRFKITENDFQIDEDWTQEYRVDGGGTSTASSPIFFGEIGQTVFANNTLPSPSKGFSLFTQPMATPPGRLQEFSAFDSDEPGFNFQMIASDPFVQQLAVYFDPINGLLSAHDIAADGMLTLRWEFDTYKPSASPAISPDRDLLYIDDYVGDHDEFVILRLSTGEELARVPLDASLPTIGTIFLGMNDDVYIISSEAPGPNGLISRIYLR